MAKRRQPAPKRPKKRQARRLPFAAERKLVHREILEQSSLDTGEPVRIEYVKLEGFPNQSQAIKFARRELHWRVRHLGSVRVGPKGRRHWRKRELRAHFTIVTYERGSPPGETEPRFPGDERCYVTPHKATRIHDIADADAFIEDVRSYHERGYMIASIGWSFR